MSQQLIDNLNGASRQIVLAVVLTAAFLLASYRVRRSWNIQALHASEFYFTLSLTFALMGALAFAVRIPCYSRYYIGCGVNEAMALGLVMGTVVIIAGIVLWGYGVESAVTLAFGLYYLDYMLNFGHFMPLWARLLHLAACAVVALVAAGMGVRLLWRLWATQRGWKQVMQCVMFRS